MSVAKNKLLFMGLLLFLAVPGDFVYVAVFSRAMTVKPKRKRVLYKKAIFLNDNPTDLETLLINALSSQAPVLDRREDPNKDGLYFRVINYNATHHLRGGQKIFGCELVAYEPGADKATVDIDPKATELPMDAFHASLDGKREFVESAAYFAVSGNHVVLSQGVTVRSLEVEKHLNWLLCSKANVLHPDNRLSLVDLAPPDARDQLPDIRGIEFSQPIAFEPAAQNGPPNAQTSNVLDIRDQRQSADKVTFRPGGHGWEAVRAFLGDVLNLPNLAHNDDIFSKGNLEVSMRLHWTTRTPGATSAFLSNIGHQMRHVDDEVDYKIFTKSGEFSREEFKIRDAVTCNWRNERPQFDEIFPAMGDWLYKLLSAGRV